MLFRSEWNEAKTCCISIRSVASQLDMEMESYGQFHVDFRYIESLPLRSSAERPLSDPPSSRLKHRLRHTLSATQLILPLENISLHTLLNFILPSILCQYPSSSQTHSRSTVAPPNPLFLQADPYLPQDSPGPT